jgi:tripartite-type tricarboxylate transporter receptor subunit TctC
VTDRRGALVALAALGLSAPGFVRAQPPAFPARPLRIVVPFAAGGVGDLTARAVASGLALRLGHPVVIDNRPGAGGVVAADAVARAEPDGHTLFLMSNGTAVTAGLFKALPYDTVADFTPISTLAVFDTAVLVPADSPHRTLPQLLAHARTHAGQLNIGSVQIGSTQNLAAELFKSSAGIDAQVVPFNGTPALITALRGRQVDAAVEILGPALPQVRAGALRVLAVASEQRSAALPEVPTALEAGVAGFVASSWNALAAPARTPRAVVDRLQREVAAAVATPAVQQQLRALNAQPRTSTPEQAAALLQADIARWRAVIERAGIPRQ